MSKTLPVQRGFGRALLEWYERHRRPLPWRGTSDPYAVWVSELMLQQTQVDTALPYFERWMARFPDLVRLAQADESEVLSAWQGLGYYSRARALSKGARAIVARGQSTLPTRSEDLRKLPGVGPYTAAAIASIAFGEDTALVDGNVARVLTRLFALPGDVGRNPLRTRLWQLAQEHLVPGRAGDYNQALMELGALVCRPARPECAACPLARYCRARADSTQARFPTKKERPAPTRVRASAAVVVRGGQLLVVQAPKDAPRWASLWLLPHVEFAAGETGAAAARRALYEWTRLRAEPRGQLGQLQHSVTRFRITLEWHALEPRGHAGPARPSELRWCTPSELPELAMPAPHRKICQGLFPAPRAPGKVR